MSDRIIIGPDGRKYITNEPLLHEDKQAAELRRLHAENERLRQINQSHEMKLSVRGYEIQIDDLKALNAELVEALRGTVQEMLSVVASLNAEQMPHDGDEFHERLEKARAALAKVEASE